MVESNDENKTKKKRKVLKPSERLGITRQTFKVESQPEPIPEPKSKPKPKPKPKGIVKESGTVEQREVVKDIITEIAESEKVKVREEETKRKNREYMLQHRQLEQDIKHLLAREKREILANFKKEYFGDEEVDYSKIEKIKRIERERNVGITQKSQKHVKKDKPKPQPKPKPQIETQHKIEKGSDWHSERIKEVNKFFEENQTERVVYDPEKEKKELIEKQRKAAEERAKQPVKEHEDLFTEEEMDKLKSEAEKRQRDKEIEKERDKEKKKEKRKAVRKEKESVRDKLIIEEEHKKDKVDDSEPEIESGSGTETQTEIQTRYSKPKKKPKEKKQFTDAEIAERYGLTVEQLNDLRENIKRKRAVKAEEKVKRRKKESKEVSAFETTRKESVRRRGDEAVKGKQRIRLTDEEKYGQLTQIKQLQEIFKERGSISDKEAAYYGATIVYRELDKDMNETSRPLLERYCSIARSRDELEQNIVKKTILINTDPYQTTDPETNTTGYWVIDHVKVHGRRQVKLNKDHMTYDRVDPLFILQGGDIDKLNEMSDVASKVKSKGETEVIEGGAGDLVQ